MLGTRWRCSLSITFCLTILDNLLKVLARVGVRLKLEIFLSSRFLIKDSTPKAKVQVRLKLESSLI